MGDYGIRARHTVAGRAEEQFMKFGLFGGAQAVPGEVVTEAALGYHEYGE